MFTLEAIEILIDDEVTEEESVHGVMLFDRF
jgi:hypothetical protein